MLRGTSIARSGRWAAVAATVQLLGCSIYDTSLLPNVSSRITAGTNTSGGAGRSAGAGTGEGGASGAAGTGTSATTAGTGGSAGASGVGGGSNGGAGGGSGDAGTATGGGSGSSGSAGAGGGAGSSPGTDAGNTGGSAGGNADAGCPKCPVGVALSGQSATPERGGNGSTRFTDLCPPQQVVIGYQGLIDTMQNSVSAIQTVCGQLVLSSAGTYRITTGTGATLTERGSRSGSPWSRMCAANEVVVGFSGRSGFALEQIAFDCAPLNVTMSQGSYALSIGSKTTLPGAGGNGGSPFAATACSTGQVARGTNLTEGRDLESFGLVCTTPVLTGADGLPL